MTNEAERRNILFVSTRAPYPPNTGHFIRTYNVIKQLSRYFNIHFLGFYDKGIDGQQQRQVHEGLSALCSTIHLEPIAWEKSIIGNGIRFLKSLITWQPFVAIKYFRPSMVAQVKKILSAHSIDLVHLDMLPLAEYVPYLEGIPVILTNHNVESLRLKRLADAETSILKRFLLLLQTELLTRYEKKVVGGLKDCITVSEEDAEYLSCFNPDCKFAIIPNGVDTGFYRRQQPLRESREILWVGSMADPYNRQGVEFFATEVFPLLIAAEVQFKWTLVGKSPPAVVKELGKKYPQQLQLLGFVDDVRPYYERASVLVVPLLSGSGTKLKVIEGMAMGMPMVMTNVGAEGLPLRHEADALITDQAAAFADAVVELLSNSKLRQQFSQNVLKQANEVFDWEIIGNNIFGLYRQLIAKGKRI